LTEGHLEHCRVGIDQAEADVAGTAFALAMTEGQMLVGVPKEIKDNEYRVGLVPSTVRELVDGGHRVLIEAGAGLGAGLADADYTAAGGEIVRDADAVFSQAELIVKV